MKTEVRYVALILRQRNNTLHASRGLYKSEEEARKVLKNRVISVHAIIIEVPAC